MALNDFSKAIVVLSAFFLPILTYLYFTRSQTPIKKKKDAGPLPAPTEITNILIHPIKSCHGIAVKKARLLPTGLDLDRQWMWVTYPDYEFLTSMFFHFSNAFSQLRPVY